MQEKHTPEEYKIINEFIESIDENVKNFVEEIVNETDKAESVAVTVLSNRAADEYVINNYDSIEYEGITTTGYLDENGKPSPMIAFKKRIDGMFYVVNAVNSSKKKKNYIVSAYIKSAKK